MAPITLDPDEVNQHEVVTLTDGRTVALRDADAATLRRVARQLHTHRSSYEAAFAPVDEALRAQVTAGEVALDEVAPLHRRVRELLELARDREGRSAAQLDLEVLLQDRTWTSASGTVRPLRDLTPTHRRNLAAWLERHSDELRDRFDAAPLTEPQRGRVADADPWVAGTPLYRQLRALVAEESGSELARDQARQVVRRVEFERKGSWPER